MQEIRVPRLWLGLSSVVLIGLFALGCPDDPTSEREITIVLEGDAEELQQREGQLASQLAEIEEERSRLLKEREALLAQMESGEDLTRLIRDQRSLLEREQELRRRESLAEAERSALTDEVSRIVQVSSSEGVPSDSGSEDPGRVRDVVRREASISSREAEIAAREKAIAEREARLALREAEVSRIDAAVVEASAAEPGRRVSASRVQNAHRRVRQTMTRRGLMMEDLPPEVARLNRRVYQLSRRGAWAEALDTVSSLSAAVSAISIDEEFIQAKMARLLRMRRDKELSTDQGREVEELLALATAAFADGNYQEANTHLNRMFGILSN